MSSYRTLKSTNFDSNDNLDALQCSEHGTFHRMLKYWRNSSKSGVSLKKSCSFLEYRISEQPNGAYGVGGMLSGGRNRCNISYKRLESCDEVKLKKM